VPGTPVPPSSTGCPTTYQQGRPAEIRIDRGGPDCGEAVAVWSRYDGTDWPPCPFPGEAGYTGQDTGCSGGNTRTVDFALAGVDWSCAYLSLATSQETPGKVAACTAEDLRAFGVWQA
jgi:hypothetical protein